MADRDSEPRSPIKDFGWLALFLIALGVIWFAQGGPQRLTTITGPFIQAPVISTPSSGERGKISEGNISLPGISLNLQNSLYKGKVSLRASNARETDPQKEYLEITAGYKSEPLPISGWTLRGREGLDITIGNGAYLVFSGQVNPQEPIILKADEKAIIITGQSPIGTSFRLNLCTGYFNQFQKFFPYLSEECPRISEKEIPVNFPDACFNFIRTLARCRMPLNIPLETQFAIGNDCINLLNEKANYSGCVAVHKNDEDFYKKEWRIYLARDKELWRERDTIILRDQEGKLIDEVSY